MSSFSIEVKVQKNGMFVIETHHITIGIEAGTHKWFWQEQSTGKSGTGYSSEEAAAEAAESYFGATRKLGNVGLN